MPVCYVFLSKLLSGNLLLTDGKAFPYSNYNKRNYEHTAEELRANEDWHRGILPDEEEQRLRRLTVSPSREKLAPIRDCNLEAQRLISQAKDLCGRSVTTRVIEDLKNRPSVNRWVEQGLQLHAEQQSPKCLFCNQSLPPGHLARLEAHFSEEYKQLIGEVGKLEHDIEEERKRLESGRLPEKALLYEEFQDDYGNAIERYESEKEGYLDLLDYLQNRLESKKEDPFMDIQCDYESWRIDMETMSSVNGLIRRHNEMSDNFQRKVEEARRELEESYVAKELVRFTELSDQKKSQEEMINKLDRELSGIKEKIEQLELGIKDHLRPAEELNEEIGQYLGHDELRFEASEAEAGYSIVREGEPARSLSEGEKTALAFLYFLRTLTDKDLEIEEGIVVIDDPVSSLDSTSLYNAFGFMKDRVQEAGQLFVLTHNFLFFRQVKNWMSYLKQRKKKDIGFYMLLTENVIDGRCSSIVILDELLRDHETEYHYLFKLVYEAANSEPGKGKLRDYYHLPNVARRLMEAFLEFTFPNEKNLYSKIDQTNILAAKKARIKRFCDTHSHNARISQPEHDASILGETPAIMKDIMVMIAETNHDHYDRMKELVTPSS